MGLGLGALLALCGVAAWPAVAAFRYEYSALAAKPTRFDSDHERQLFPGLVEAEWSVDSVVVRGWFVPGKNGAGVLLVHGSGGHRETLRAEMRLLADAGFSVLSFDLPGHGESGGKVNFGGINRRAISGAVDYLVAREEVAPERIGAFGFSYGGYDLVQVAASDERIRAVAVAGSPGNVMDQARYEYPGRAGISLLGARAAMWWFDVPTEETPSDDVVSRLAPRPFLALHGSEDWAVPRELVRRLYERAGEPKEWLDVPGAGHGAYAKAAPKLYREKLAGFFERSLLP